MMVETENTEAYDLRLLGGFDLRNSQGLGVPITSTKAKALLGYVAVQKGEPVPRSTLAGLFWGDREEEQAQGSLRQTLSALRKALGDDQKMILTTSSEGVSINPACLGTDLGQMITLGQSGTRDDLEASVSLYNGPLMDGLQIDAGAFEDWLRLERRRCQDVICATLHRLIGLAGETEPALSHARHLLEIDPFGEDACRMVMHLAQALGRSNDAILTYLEHQRLLNEELDVEPDKLTRQLYEEILSGRGEQVDDKALLRQDGRPSLAVMPFENLGDDTDQSHFSEGITEDIIIELSRSPDLLVIARGSTFTYRNRPVAVQDIAREFGVQYVVQGSVRKTGNQVRVTVQLIEAATGKHIWAERYDRELNDVFALQDELTQGIVAVLPGRIENFQTSLVIRKPPDTMAAYELLLSGKFHHHQLTRDDCVKALDFLDQAILLDPNYAAAYAWKACVLGQAAGRGFLDNPQALVEGATDAVSMALRLDENEVEAHRVMAEIAIDNKRLPRAVFHNDRALTLSPCDPRLLAQKGELMTWLGQPEKGCDWLNLAMRLDPYSAPLWSHLLGRAQLMCGDYATAADNFLNSSFPRFGYHAEAAGCLAQAQKPDEARLQVEQVLRMNPGFTVSEYVDGLAFADPADRQRHKDILATTRLPL